MARVRGYTLVEMMMTLAIAAVLSALAYPAFQTMTLNNRRTVLANELVTSFMLARTETAKRGAPVTVCGNTASGGTSCTGGTDWSYGWMVFTDVNGNGAFDAGDVLLKKYVSDWAYGGPGIGVRITSAIFPAGGTNGYVVMQPFNQSGTVATLTLCDKRGAAHARAVSVAVTGRAAVSDRDANNGNAALACP